MAITLQTLRTVESISTGISLIALIFSLLLFTDIDLDWQIRAPNAALLYWTPQTLWLNESKAISQIPSGNLLSDVDELSSLRFIRDPEDSVDRRNLVGVVSNLEPGMLRVWIPFLFIFGFSILFQGYRSNMLMNVDDEEHPPWDPRKPDLSRWLEYALTAPWQILLVAGTVQLHDLTAWYGLFAATVALMFIGYCVEVVWYEMHKASKADAEANEPNKGPAYLPDENAVWVLTAAGWFVHLATFAALGILKYFRSKDLFDTLNPDFEPKLDWSPIDATLIGQFIFFSSFGLVQLAMLRVLPVLVDWIDVDDEFYKVKDASGSEELKIELKDDTDRTMVRSAFAYSILSVTSKLFLEIVFIFVFAAMPGFEYKVS